MESTNINLMRFQIKSSTKERLLYIICLICIFLFLYTAVSKILEHDRFLKGLSRVQAIGGYAVYISWSVPVTEIIVSILLIIPKTVKWGLSGFITLMIIFTVYIISMILWAKKLPCHCGGVIERLNWTQHVWFNLAFIALSIFAFSLRNSNNTQTIFKI